MIPAFYPKQLTPMRLLLIPVFLFFTLTASAQIGIKASYNFHSSPYDAFTNNNDGDLPTVDNAPEIALNYWFRLPTKRVEFMPSVFYSTTNTSNTTSNLNLYGAEMKVNLYPFDFGGDCDCPTFGKQGPQLQKGFFVQLSGGYARYDSGEIVENVVAANGQGAIFGAGVGLDFGLSNLITLTPMASFRHGPGLYEGIAFTDLNGQPLAFGKNNMMTYQLGLQVSFRFDHKKY